MPAVLESNGRPSDELVTFVKSYGDGLSLSERSEVIAKTWRGISRTLQFGNAEMVMSALATLG